MKSSCNGQLRAQNMFSFQEYIIEKNIKMLFKRFKLAKIS